MPGGLHADWDFSLISRRAQALYGADDCEDFAIAKYFSLRHLGVSSDKLRITYVKAVSLDEPIWC